MDAVSLLENLGLKVKFTGVGKVKKQSINPGDIFKKNQINNYRIIVNKLKDILYKVTIESVHGTTDLAY
jgi:hypothetical protein